MIFMLVYHLGKIIYDFNERESDIIKEILLIKIVFFWIAFCS